MIDDRLSILDIEVLQYRDDHSTVSDRRHKDDAPVHRVSPHQGDTVTALYARLLIYIV